MLCVSCIELLASIAIHMLDIDSITGALGYFEQQHV